MSERGKKLLELKGVNSEEDSEDAPSPDTILELHKQRRDADSLEELQKQALRLLIERLQREAQTG
jgi:hypothetical protein